MDYDSKASTTLGSLRAQSTLSVAAGRISSPIVYLETYSYFNDSFTFNGRAGTGLVSLGLHIDGQGIDQTQPVGFNGGVGTSTLWYFIGPTGTSGYGNPIDATNKTISQRVYSNRLPITFGSPVDLAFVIIAETAVYCDGNNIGPGCGIWSTSRLNQTNFYDTAILDAIQVMDDNGNPLGGISVSSASGTDYSAAIVPEPMTRKLMIAALSALGLVARIRRHRMSEASR